LIDLSRERFSESVFFPPWLRWDHFCRNQFAAGYVEGKLVVDCASGDGTGSAMLGRAGGRAVLGFDRSVAEIRGATRRMRDGNVSYCVASANHLPLRDRSVDVYVSLETIEHLDDDREFLRDAVRVLRAGGLFICSTPNRSVTNPSVSLEGRPANPYHVREYSSEEFRALLGEFFPRIEFFGQNPKPVAAVRRMETLGMRLSPIGAVRWNQIMKVLFVPFDRQGNHAVIKPREGFDFEYNVAVCFKTTG